MQKTYYKQTRTGSGRPGSGKGIPAYSGTQKKGEPTEEGDVRKEKEQALVLIANEIKKYDLEEMKEDISHKMATNLHDLKKNQR